MQIQKTDVLVDQRYPDVRFVPVEVFGALQENEKVFSSLFPKLSEDTAEPDLNERPVVYFDKRLPELRFAPLAV